MLNMWSHTGILVYVNNTTIVWFSKQQYIVELYSFGSELIALRVVTEIMEALR